MSEPGFKPLSIRLPVPLHAWLASSAERNFRSVTSEIAARLDAARLKEEEKVAQSGGGPMVEVRLEG